MIFLDWRKCPTVKKQINSFSGFVIVFVIKTVRRFYDSRRCIIKKLNPRTATYDKIQNHFQCAYKLFMKVLLGPKGVTEVVEK